MLHSPGRDHRGEGLVDLEEADVVDREIGASRATLLVAGIGPVSMITGSTPAMAKATKRALGLSPSSRGFVLAHDQQRGGAVGDL